MNLNAYTNNHQLIFLSNLSTNRTVGDSVITPVIVRVPTVRYNIAYKLCELRDNSLMHLLSECWRKYKFDENLQERIVIFCRKKETVQEMNAFLNGSSFITTMSTLYTGDLTEEERSTNMQAFSNEESETRIMVATKAFGMGMDYASIRLVIHLHSPETMLDYVQESGRAGRDGKKSEAVLLFDQSDLKSKFVSEEMKRMIQDDSACLRTPVSLEMDGEYSCCLILPKAEPCSRCSTLMPADNCQNKTVPAETQKDANPRSVGIECYEASRMTS